VLVGTGGHEPLATAGAAAVIQIPAVAGQADVAVTVEQPARGTALAHAVAQSLSVEKAIDGVAQPASCTGPQAQPHVAAGALSRSFPSIVCAWKASPHGGAASVPT
jgi:hypothetical protein